MTRIRRSTALAAVAATLFLVSCSGSQLTGPHAAAVPKAVAHGDVWTLAPGADTARASASLAHFILQHPESGFRVLAVGSDGLGVGRGLYKFMLQPQIGGPGKANWLVVNQLYAVKEPLAKKTDALKELCFEVNTTMRFLHASVQQTPQGALFVARSEFPFADSLPLRQLGAYLDALKRATLTIGGQRMTSYLK